MSRFDDATLSQHRAAEPGSSTWLSANAGSGKTRVLTERVARLLLSQVPPQNILCLTYTKAAAGEMQNRLFRDLGAWAMLPDDDLETALRKLGVDGPVDLRRARTLFASAIETPGGMKILTIHSFCAALLRRFPLEAGVSPGFEEMDDSAQRHLLSEVLETLAADDPDRAVSSFLGQYAGDDIARLAADIVGRRDAFAGPSDRAAVLAEYGHSANETPDAILSTAGLDLALLGRVADACAQGSSNDVRAATALNAVTGGPVTPDTLAALEDVLLYKSGAKAFTSKAGAFPTKTTRAALGADADALDALMDRVEQARLRRIALAAAERTHALRVFAGVLIPAYEQAKQARGWLDFDDLIDKTRALLKDRAAAAWVLYRLDGSIDHILVDEAQDTSPAQWEIIELLTQEFGAGAGARDTHRTLFVVGDKKQSIYSFQGADAGMFDDMKGRFTDRLRQTGGLRSAGLQHSFRSSPAILRTVDKIFDADADSGIDARHIAYFDALPGRVDLWPVVPKPDRHEPAPWDDPLDLVAPDDPATVLAAKIADELHRLIHVEKVTIPVQRKGEIFRRPMTEGDVLILVQGRTGSGELFHAINRALKVRKLAVAGADRLRIDAELAVRDLVALCAFIDLPEDSLSLATVLRSPLFGWSEDDLFRLAHGRTETHLWRALQARGDPRETIRVLEDLRDASDYLRPYDLLERILVRHDGRRKLVARLGHEAEDGIDEILNQALAYERQEVPSLTGFLVWLEGEATEIKRPSDQAAGQVQVMTVHGAKGLERPVVILPDTLRGERAQRGHLITDDTGQGHWKGAVGEIPANLRTAVDLQASKAAEERQRLLYVALTRAESWLIVCGAGNDTGETDTWYGKVRAGMQRAGADPQDFPTGPGLRVTSGDWTGPDLRSDDQPEAVSAAKPGWLWQRAAAAPVGITPVTPSDLGGDKVLPSEAADPDQSEAALRRGRQVHLLLEHLAGQPPAARQALATSLLAHGLDAATAEDARALAQEVGALLDDPALADVFGPAALAEVEVSAALPDLGGTRMHGLIDRLVIGDDSVLIVDFKTNRAVPARPEDVPEGLLRQMGAYLSAVEQIYPDRTARAGILWTTSRQLMELPHEIVRAALAASPVS